MNALKDQIRKAFKNYWYNSLKFVNTINILKRLITNVISRCSTDLIF